MHVQDKVLRIRQASTVFDHHAHGVTSQVGKTGQPLDNASGGLDAHTDRGGDQAIVECIANIGVNCKGHVLVEIILGTEYHGFRCKHRGGHRG